MHPSDVPRRINSALPRTRWRLRFGVSTLLLGVAAVGVALAWFMRTDRFYDSLQVYAFQQSTADGQTLRGAVAFVRQNRLYPTLRRLEFAILVDSGMSIPGEAAELAELEMKHLGSYAWAQHRGCRHLEFVDGQARYGTGWTRCLDETAFETGAVHEVCGMRDRGPYEWQAIARGEYALVVQTKSLTFTWKELLRFVQDPAVDRWTIDAVHRWKEGRL